MAHEAETKTCQNCKKDFTIEPEDFNFYEKIKVPPPTFCPECRLIRKLNFRNERFMYHNVCALCNKKIISIISKDSNVKVYCPDCWWGDGWDQLKYGKVYDFSTPFFEQFKAIMEEIPWVSLQTIHTTLKNSEYVNMCAFSKNCYLTSHADHNEDCMYSSGIKFSKNCLDCLMSSKLESCYFCINCVDCHKVFYSSDCRQSYEVFFSKNLVGCNNCFGCINLVNKSYCIFNKQYSRDDYFKKIEDMDLDKHSNLEQHKLDCEKFFIKYPQKYYHGFYNTKVLGDYIYQSKNVEKSYEVFGSENCKFCYFLSTPKSKDCFDYVEWGDSAELVYESIVCGVNLNNIKFSWVVQNNSTNISYSMHCSGCNDCFGCIALRNKQYCILNKQYTKEQYEELVPKIIKHMNDMPYISQGKNPATGSGQVYKYGEFFPSEFSLYSYNETVQDFFPISKEESINRGYKWKDREKRNYEINIENEKIPDSITKTSEDIVGKIIECSHKGECNEQCTEAFKIIESEYSFYKRMNLPLPRLCPNCRHYARLKQRNPLKLWHRKCMKEGCHNEFETSYSPDRPEIVYCEKCYQQEVY